MMSGARFWWFAALGWCAVFLGAAGGMAQDTPEDALDAAAMEAEFDEYAEFSTPAVRDPFERFNRSIFKFNNTATKFVLRPVSKGYETVVPDIAQRGLRSFFTNLRFPVRFVGCLLQGKVDRGMTETAKFLINTTVGVGGFFDVAGQEKSLRVPSEDIGQAFGKWGIGHGPYLVLPVLGPSSLRDLAGVVGDSLLSPVNRRVIRNFEWEYGLAYTTTNALHQLPDRLRTLDELQRMSVDPYIAMRNGYVQFREAEVKK